MQVLVSGPDDPADPTVLDRAHEVGRRCAEHGWTVLTGGLGGAMAAAAAGVAEEGGTAVALLPGADRAAASAGHTVVLGTGLGELRNGLLVRCADAVVAVGASWGTLSEVALAARTGVPVVVLGTDLPAFAGPEVQVASDPADAVRRLVALVPGCAAPDLDVGGRDQRLS